MSLDYSVRTSEIELFNEKYIQAYIAELPGLKVYVTSYEEVRQEIDSAKKEWFSSYLSQDKVIPEPIKVGEKSGRVTLRMTKSLHEKVDYYAEEEGVSLNQYLVHLIENGFYNLKINKISEELKDIVNSQNHLDETISNSFNYPGNGLEYKTKIKFDVEPHNRISNSQIITGKF